MSDALEAEFARPVDGTGDSKKRLLVAQQRAYLNARNIKPGSQFQLDLLFPDTIGQRDDLRHIPNDYARSSLFTARNHRVQRQHFLRKKLFHYNEHVTILYTGIELRAADDELVWMQILAYGRGVPLGTPYSFSLTDLISDIGWPRSGHSYQRVRECMSRLKSNEVLADNAKAYGKSEAISLIARYEAENDENGTSATVKVWINPGLILLFAGSTFTSHSWLRFRDLTPVARRLADYIESHHHPYPLSLAKFKAMCGSEDSSRTSWRQTVRRACSEIQEAGIAKHCELDAHEMICCIAAG